MLKKVLIVGGIVVFGMSMYGVYEYYKIQLDLLYNFSYKITKLKYISAKKNDNIESSLQEFINCKDAVIMEVFCCIQGRYPRLNAIKNDDGTFTNRPFEDMDPFMPREEFENEMIVKIV